MNAPLQSVPSVFFSTDSASFSRTMKPTHFLTIGHGTRAATEFVALLRGAGIERLVDVRSIPKSRHNPQFARDELSETLAAAGIVYMWEPRLGGLRGKPPEASPDLALRNDSFRNYAAHMRTPPFREALAELLESAARQRTAIMCSESLWWRCHRRMIADHVTLIEGFLVEHIMHDGRIASHHPTDAARVAGDDLVYDVIGAQLPLVP
jgi:uncharacterized protein (DUF488 family)